MIHYSSPSNAWYWREPPRFLDEWNIDINSNYQFPFSVVIPATELRHGEWALHRDKGTVWLPSPNSAGVEVAIFLVRTNGDISAGLTSAGWTATVVDTLLPDGRRLVAAAGPSTITAERLHELETAKNSAKAAITHSAPHRA